MICFVLGGSKGVQICNEVVVQHLNFGTFEAK